MEWNPLQHPDIVDGYDISPYGDIRYNKSNLTYKATYHSSNGYDYAPFILNDSESNINNGSRLFPIDEIIAMVYIPVPHELCGKRLTVKHINGDNRDISLSNLEWIEDIEIWKDVEYKNIKRNQYKISSKGRLKRYDKILTPYIDKSGYYRYTVVTENNKWKSGMGEHQLVCNAFVKHLSETENMVNHIDGIKTHNIPKNLEWTTAKENSKHAILTGLRGVGENHWWSHFKKKDIELICQALLDYNGNVKAVLNHLKDTIPNLNRWIISVIKCKNCWKSVSDKFFSYDRFKHIEKTYINENIVKRICQTLVENNGNIKDTMNDLHNEGYRYVTKNHITKIKYKLLWNDISDEYFDYSNKKFIIK